MNKSVKILILIVVILIIAGLTAVLIKKQPTQILFYSDTCPHCKLVEQYITDNNVRGYLVFRELEVSTNTSNSQLLGKKAAGCGINGDSIGVPLFFDGQNCLVGDSDIIKYFASKK